MPAPNRVTAGAAIPAESSSLVVAEMNRGYVTLATASRRAPNASATKIRGKRSSTKGALAHSGVTSLLGGFLAQIRPRAGPRFPFHDGRPKGCENRRGGRSGIRTHERVAPLTVFKTVAFVHPAILPPGS